jgi:rubrerythrin
MEQGWIRAGETVKPEQKGELMDPKKFMEIVQFAIQREIESVNFYDEAKKIVKHSGTRELFSDFAKQEKGHKKKLEEVQSGKIVLGRIEKVPNLQISDYLVDIDFRPDLSYADILRVAMKMEERSLKLYTDLRETAKDKEIEKLFEFLSSQEAKHKYRLEKIYDEEILK